MYPTVKDGTVLVINKLKEADYNDIVTIYSSDLGKYLCKRVIGLEGDTIDIKDGIVYRNGSRLDEAYNKDKETNGRYTVDTNEVFVMGDNRNNSTDSRELGCFRKSDIEGVCIWNTGISKAKFIFFVILLVICILLNIKVEFLKSDKRSMKNKQI